MISSGKNNMNQMVDLGGFVVTNETASAMRFRIYNVSLTMIEVRCDV